MMANWRLTKEIEIAGAHQLSLPYDSKCKKVHGHNWIITVEIVGQDLVDGMLMDFTHIKKAIMGPLDHAYVNDLVEQPTAENMAKWVADKVTEELEKFNPYVAVAAVTVVESRGNKVCYTT